MDAVELINSGVHADDELNVPDNDGRVRINIGHPLEDQDIFVLPSIARVIKPHQIGGIRFLYDTVVENVNQFHVTNGSGCILAHSMGLGKTLQIIAFIEILHRHVGLKTAIIVLPLCVLYQWGEEFDRYIPKRLFNVYIYTQNLLLTDWIESGGVLLIGYDAIRNLLTSNADKLLYRRIHNAQLLVFDEGHRLKNQDSRTLQSLSSIKSHRKIILTGFPFQNHLLEYWTMVNFVKPNYLLGIDDFSKIFKKPIEEGQYTDSTNDQISLMNARCDLLHSLLEPIVQRRSQTVLLQQLPPKSEYVIFIKMTEFQMLLYNKLMEERIPLLTKVSFCRKIFSHPDLLLEIDIGNDVDDLGGDGECNADKIEEKWFKQFMGNYSKNVLDRSPKMQILIEILSEITSSKSDEKIIVFSLSTATLNHMEFFVTTKLHLRNGWTYLRIDGSMNINKRTSLMSEFNRNASIKLMLLSTKASSLGLNLVAACKVVIFEPSWNPCDDEQACSRVYRFGQVKPTAIYRFIMDTSIETAILYRQVNKINMANRVVDGILTCNEFAFENLRLFDQAENHNEVRFLDCDGNYNDALIINIIKKHHNLLSRPPKICDFK